jgi:hypothetical protein
MLINPYPQRCPRCRNEAYVGAAPVDIACSNARCVFADRSPLVQTYAKADVTTFTTCTFYTTHPPTRLDDMFRGCSFLGGLRPEPSEWEKLIYIMGLREHKDVRFGVVTYTGSGLWTIEWGSQTEIVS